MAEKTPWYRDEDVFNQLIRHIESQKDNYFSLGWDDFLRIANLESAQNGNSAQAVSFLSLLLDISQTEKDVIQDGSDFIFLLANAAYYLNVTFDTQTGDPRGRLKVKKSNFPMVQTNF